MPRTLALATALVLAGCDTEPDETPNEAPTCDAPGPLDDVLRIAHIQGLGTHNSYHVQPEAVLHPSWAYTHPTLTDQLDRWGVRQVELDVHRTVDGVWEVFHLPGVDAGTTCRRFADCLAELEAWSAAHPCHAPLMVWIEPKDDIDSPAIGYTPLPDHLRELDDEILTVWPRARVLTPDDVRGEHPDLPSAVRAVGWPTLGEARGRVIFALLDTGAHRDAYIGDDPTVRGRVIFPGARSPDEPWAAAFKIDDAVGQAARVGALVAEGFLVTSNADGPDEPADENQRRFDGTLAAGSNWISTNAPDAGPNDPFRPVIPGGTPLRCNPVSAPEGCTSEALEDLR